MPPLEEVHVGIMLRRAREQRGLSAHDVAEKTRISVRWIFALEAAKFEGLPAEVFVSGYLRSYARAVGLDGTALLASYRELMQKRGLEAAQAERASRGHSSALTGAHFRLLLLGFGLLVLIVVGACLWFWVARRSAV